MWALSLSQWSIHSDVWPDLSIRWDSNVPTHLSPSCHQCPWLFQPCLNTNQAGGSLPPGWPIHFMITFTVRQVLCPKAEMLAFPQPPTDTLSRLPSHTTTPQIFRRNKSTAPKHTKEVTSALGAHILKGQASHVHITAEETGQMSYYIPKKRPMKLFLSIF